MIKVSHIVTAAASILAFASMAVSAQSLTQDEVSSASPVVVELFTSQGCSSCPPADAVLRTLKERDDILALSWAVDYWDRLGWRDTFGNSLNSRRQRVYNKRLGRSGVYTPQMIIDGQFQAVGSRRGDVSAAIQAAAKAHHPVASPTLSLAGDAVQVALPKTNSADPISVRVVWYLSEATVDVQRGENRGRQLIYTNVVRKTQLIEDWDGASKTLTLARSDGRNVGADNVAVLLHRRYGEGEIIGAAHMALNADSLALAR